MTNKKKFLLLTSISALTFSAVAIIGSSRKISLFAGANDGTGWRHYDAVARTLTSNGSKEYWTNCQGVTQLTAPEGAVAVDYGAPSSEFVSSLSKDDARYVPALAEGIDFNDGEIPSILTFSHSGDGEQAIVEAGPDNSKCLKVKTHSSTKVYLSADAMTAMFALSGNPDAILFDIKVETAISSKNYFYYESASNTYGVVNYNSFDGGLNTGWATYYFPKAALSDLKASGAFIRVDSSSNYVYLDNIRPGEATSRERGCNFDKAFTTNNSVYESLYGSASFDNQEFFKVATETGMTATVSFESAPGIVSQGTKSLHVVTDGDGKLMTYINSTFYNALPDEGVKFDIYSATGSTIFNMLEDWQTAQRWKAFDYTRAGKWITVTVPKESIVSGRNLLFRTQNPGGAIDFYIDNVRPAA